MTAREVLLRSGALLSVVCALGCGSDVAAADDGGPRECHAEGCASGVDFVAHLSEAPAGPVEVTACRAGECVTMTTDRITGVGASHDLWLQPIDERTFRASVHLRERTVSDGDRYHFYVADASGRELLHLERGVVYGEHEFPNGRTCDEPEGLWCRRAEVHVWPTSTSGLSCTGNPLESGASIELRPSLPAAALNGAMMKVCRNDTCALRRYESPPCDRPLLLDGALETTARWLCRDGLVEAVQVFAFGDPTWLADGDRYRVWLLSTDDAPLVAFDRAAAYEETFPNGPLCDAHPRKLARVE